jgi:hypothetical protein
MQDLLLWAKSRSLLRFAYKPFKNRRLVDFLPCKLRKAPIIVVLWFFNEKGHKNLQAQQAPSLYQKACRGQWLIAKKYLTTNFTNHTNKD